MLEKSSDPTLPHRCSYLSKRVGCHTSCVTSSVRGCSQRGVLFLRASIAIGIGRYAIGTENDVRRTKFFGTLGTFREKSRDARQLSGEDHAFAE